MTGIQFLCTIGPASHSAEVIQGLESQGATLLRINLSHTPIERLASTIAELRAWTRLPICLDTEGAQVRTGSSTGLHLQLGDLISLVGPNGHGIELTPAGIADRLHLGDILHLDFDGAVLRIEAGHEMEILGRVITPGFVGANKGVEVPRRLAAELPAFTPKDRAAIAIGLDLGISHFALSFANNGQSVRAFWDLLPSHAHVTAKIETMAALHNAAEIAQEADAVLVDRGDLSRQVPIALIPLAQRLVISRASSVGKPTYIATNLVETMIVSRQPTRAEANDIYSCLEAGAQGLVLAAETAIGRNPVASLAFVKEVHVGWTAMCNGEIKQLFAQTNEA